jgi:hypothetical protein
VTPEFTLIRRAFIREITFGMFWAEVHSRQLSSACHHGVAPIRQISCAGQNKFIRYDPDMFQAFSHEEFARDSVSCTYSCTSGHGSVTVRAE